MNLQFPTGDSGERQLWHWLLPQARGTGIIRTLNMLETETKALLERRRWPLWPKRRKSWLPIGRHKPEGIPRHTRWWKKCQVFFMAAFTQASGARFVMLRAGMYSWLLHRNCATRFTNFPNPSGKYWKWKTAGKAKDVLRIRLCFIYLCPFKRWWRNISWKESAWERKCSYLTSETCSVCWWTHGIPAFFGSAYTGWTKGDLWAGEVCW